MTIQVEKLRANKADEAYQLYETVLGAHPHTTPQALVDRLTNGQGIFIIAVDTHTNKVVGIKFGYVAGDTCIGRGIAVLPAYRRQGIATQLLHVFEAEMAANPQITAYVFGSATTEGIPFHLASGYSPVVLIQFEDRALRAKLDLTGFTIIEEGYNESYQVYQIYAALPAPEQNLAYLRHLQQRFPAADVQFVFSKKLRENDDPVATHSTI